MEFNQYQEGKIYKLTSPDHDKIYIGSCYTTLKARLSRHLTNKNNECSSRLLGKNLQIELIEHYPSNSKKELEKREGEIQLQYKDQIVNKCIMGQTRKEYRKRNKEVIDGCYKRYRENNVEKIKEEKKKWNENNKERIKEYNRLYQLKLKEKGSA